MIKTLKHGHLVETPMGRGLVRGFRGADVLVRLDSLPPGDLLPTTPRRFCREAVTAVTCAWFLLCINIATRTRHHPVLDPVPICGRCDRKIERLT